jgi:hypothetical protein
MVNRLSEYFITRFSEHKFLATEKIWFGGRSQTPNELVRPSGIAVSNPV